MGNSSPQATGTSAQVAVGWLAILLGTMVGGCAVGPGYRAPSTEVPEQWPEPMTQSLAKGEADVTRWWRVFNDQKLSELIDRAAVGNLDLRLAALRVLEARALRGVALGGLLPSLGGQGSYQRSKSSANGPMAFPQSPGKAEVFGNTVARGVAVNALGAGLGTAVPGAQAVAYPLASGLIGLVPSPSGLPETDETNLLTTGFDASWEIDVFGGIRRNVESADAALEASIEDYRGTLVSLLGEVASTYIEIRTLQSQIESTKRNITVQKETVALTRSRLALELATELDVEQAETNLATTESQLPQLQSALSVSIYRLSVLLGQEPSALMQEMESTAPIPQSPSQVLVGVPTDILRQRPDIRSAERRLAAQTARIGVAASELYPRLTLSGSFGFQSTDFNHALDARSITYGFGPSVRWNIFDGLRNLNRVAAQEAVAHQAFVSYQRTVLAALQEVESSLIAYQLEQTRREALSRATESAKRTVSLAETLYGQGLVDFQNVLDAQRSLVSLENALAQSSGQVAINLVSIYKALGGGWSPELNPQNEYLENGSEALSDPMGFFLSGGKKPMPWEDIREGQDGTR